MLFSAGRPRLIMARLFTTAVAVGAIGWAFAVMPVFWTETGIAQAATHIIAGEVYKPETMGALEAELERGRGAALRSSMLSKAAIIRLRGAESAIATGNQQIIDRNLNILGQSNNRALANAPSDSFQWLVLYWLANTRDGFKPEHLRYLQLSYVLGPDEGWVAIKRNRLALAFFQVLPADLKEAAVAEFAGLVRSHFYAAAADILAGPGWQARHILLARLNELKEFKDADRRELARLLHDRNIDDVPELATRQQRRPWQH